MKRKIGVDIRMKSSTIVETLVASVIIVIVFSIASLTLNNVFRTSILSDTSSLETHIDKIIYLNKNNMLQLPLDENFKGWQLSFSKKNGEINVEAHKEVGKGKIKNYNKVIMTHDY